MHVSVRIKIKDSLLRENSIKKHKKICNESKLLLSPCMMKILNLFQCSDDMGSTGNAKPRYVS